MDSSLSAKVALVNHPVFLHKLSLIRKAETDTAQFRQLIHEAGLLLAMQATSDLDLIRTTQQRSPIDYYQGVEIKDNVGLFPILRAGLGLVDAFRVMVPEARVHHLGLYREKSTLLPVEYYNKLPSKCTTQIGIVLDPIIATAGTAIAAINILKDWGLTKIKFVAVLGSRPGISALQQAHPDIQIIVGEIDDGLSEDGYIIPGLGDAGDRLFGTVHE
ncbi:uracil phosphoribosyltransferase-domain-containing protein [Polychytrium aggregatum]|uniref:uracil phosphoribosyltransferase-domain-containing protein n=1 Tax=Polychytrium aggregatum TaxID=110093 RepID=UPI0022FDF92F|nr:uracil phosphoribosyltransferase-domain-containing protein [Polychytrium aggregatum]KAI9208446.1 uracil phosphoribosyltransferase-domain-containing protein [Polychytrium aggregatum]